MQKKLLFTLLFTLLLSTVVSVAAKQSIHQLRQQAQLNAKAGAEFILSFQKQNKGAVTFATVGADSCDFTTVQAAVDSGVDEVRIATNMTYSENVFITDKSVVIRGGYSNCVNAVNDVRSTDKSHIIGVANASEPVIAITGSSQRNMVTIENIDLSNGTGTNFLKGGGISTLDSDASIALSNVAIHDNNSDQGGGIGIFGDSIGANTDFLLVDTLIYNNSATQYGGGLYCIGSKSSVLIIGESGISANTVMTTVKSQLEAKGGQQFGHGGGAYISKSCKFTMYSGTKNSHLGPNPDYRGIAYNHAEFYGGGIYARLGAIVELNGHQFCFNLGTEICLGDTSNPININDNTAQYGAAVNVNNSPAGLKIYAGLVENNHAEFIAGAIDVSYAYFETAQLYPACWSQTLCNTYRNNKADLRAGALRISGDVAASIYATHFIGNRAQEATVLELASNAIVNSEGSIYRNNGNFGNDGFTDIGIIYSQVDADSFNSIHDTFADNHVTSTVFKIESNLDIKSSIIAEDANLPIIAVPVAYASSANFNCIIASESNSFSSHTSINATDIEVADPVFVDRNAGDYHISAISSPAVDRCGNAFAQHTDIDNENRGWNDPSVPNQSAVAFNSYDAGADETYGNDIIFKHGFEL